jgi:hypothetical protein
MSAHFYVLTYLIRRLMSIRVRTKKDFKNSSIKKAIMGEISMPKRKSKGNILLMG